MSQAMTQPRDEQGRFTSIEKVTGGDKVELQMSEFEARMIANRLFKVASLYEDNEFSKVDQECRKWAKRFHDKCMGRENDDEYYEEGNKRHVDAVYTITVSLTEHEIWELGNRLWEAGDYYGQSGNAEVEGECKWWARRFHALRDEE